MAAGFSDLSMSSLKELDLLTVTDGWRRTDGKHDERRYGLDRYFDNACVILVHWQLLTHLWNPRPPVKRLVRETRGYSQHRALRAHAPFRSSFTWTLLYTGSNILYIMWLL